MFCVHCGKELKERARFCSACGAPVSSEEALSNSLGTGVGSVVTEFSSGEGATQESRVGFAGQMESDRKRSRKKLSPLMIIAIVLALLAGTALAAVLVTQQANQGEEPSAQGQPQESQTVESELTPEQRFIKSLDGWWYTDSYNLPGGASHPVALHYYENGTVFDLGADADMRPDVTDEPRVYNIVEVKRYTLTDSDATGNLKGHAGEGLWNVFDGDFYFSMLDSDPNTLMTGEGMFTRYRVVNPEKLKLIEESVDARSIIDRAVQKEDSTASSNSNASNPTGSEAKFDQEKAEAEARAAAEAAGMTVLTGTVFIGTEADWAEREGRRAPNPGDSFMYVGLILDEPVTVSARNADGATSRERPYVERSGEYVLLGGSYQSDVVDAWSPYNGQRVSAAFSDFGSFSDSLGALFAFKGTGERIAPLTEADVSASDVGGGSNGDYVLPDSATRRYSRQELERFDDHTLFLARNEIYARHGRKFDSSELQRHFGSKSWYNGTIEPAAFTDAMLNDVEYANAHLMLDIEKARGSAYV